jgi:hypothetical protein
MRSTDWPRSHPVVDADVEKVVPFFLLLSLWMFPSKTAGIGGVSPRMWDHMFSTDSHAAHH